MKIGTRIRNFKIPFPFQLQIPSVSLQSSSRQIFGYSAVGAAAICLSYQYIRHGLWTSGIENEAEKASNIWQRIKLLPSDNKYLRNLLFFIRKYFLLESVTKISGDRQLPLNNAILFCQLALDGVEIKEKFRPEITLCGTFSESDLAKFELESAHWTQKLMNIFKFKSIKEKERAEEQLFAASNQGEEINEDLNGDEEFIATMGREPEEPGKTKLVKYLKQYNTQRRMAKLVKQLEIQFEIEPECVHPLSKDIPWLLINILDRFRGRNEQITISILKVLANNVQFCRQAGELVAKSDWLPLLASMVLDPFYDKERVLAHKVLVNTLYSLGAQPDNVLLPHLYELHRPKSGQIPKIDIIFVHGLRGSAFHSWRQRERQTLFWPKDWLAQDLRVPVRLIALDYSSQLQRSPLKSLDNLEARSHRFQVEFERAGIGKRPILFICHSLGGLLVKKMLINDPKLLNQTVGILFISTPHLGTPVATKYGQNFLMPTEDVLLLKTESHLNRELNEHFQSQSKQIPLICTVLECRATPIFREKLPMVLVPFESGIFGRGTVYHLDEHHHHLCKPIDRNSPIYGIIRNFVNDSLEYLEKNNSMNVQKPN